MGFTPRRTVYVLDFTGTQDEGLEVRMTASTIGAMFDAPELLGIKQGIDAMDPADESAAAVRLMLDGAARMLEEISAIADHLVSWNIDGKDGRPLPADLEGLKTLETPFVTRIARAWQAAMTDVAPPLPDGSGTGASADLTGIPMTTVPASLLSSSTPS